MTKKDVLAPTKPCSNALKDLAFQPKENAILSRIARTLQTKWTVLKWTAIFLVLIYKTLKNTTPNWCIATLQLLAFYPNGFVTVQTTVGTTPMKFIVKMMIKY